MYIEHHDLAKEFPEFRSEIHALKASDAHFARIFQEYQELDKHIIRLEENLELDSDQMLEHLKRKRVHLKDELYQQLNAAASA
ncbi:MAG: YdcH family protein [Myxococcota bacterium]